MATILITEFMDEAAVSGLGRTHAVHYDPGLVDKPDELARRVADADALVVRNRTQVRGSLLAAGAKLTCVGRLGVGLDNIDVAACKARGIAVFPATGANDLSVAEYVVTAALMLLRGAYLATGDVADGKWPRNRLMGREVSGKRLGLVGYGAIARETSVRAIALGMTVAAYDPYLPGDSPAWTGVTKLPLDQLVESSDVISLHVPLTEETRDMIGTARIARMKQGAILINAARGGVVDEAAVAAALKAGTLGGAALDVFATEPLDAAKGAVFAGCPNLILTPHIAGVTQESNVRVSSLVADLVAKHLAGG